MSETEMSRTPFSAFVRPTKANISQLSLCQSYSYHTAMSATRGKVSSLGLEVTHELIETDSTRSNKGMAPRLSTGSGPRKLGEPYSLGLDGET